MKKVHISYGNEDYYKSLDLLEKSSMEIGKIDKEYNLEWVNVEKANCIKSYTIDP